MSATTRTVKFWEVKYSQQSENKLYDSRATTNSTKKMMHSNSESKRKQKSGWCQLDINRELFVIQDYVL